MWIVRLDNICDKKAIAYYGEKFFIDGKGRKFHYKKDALELLADLREQNIHAHIVKEQ